MDHRSLHVSNILLSYCTKMCLFFLTAFFDCLEYERFSIQISAPMTGIHRFKTYHCQGLLFLSCTVYSEYVNSMELLNCYHNESFAQLNIGLKIKKAK